MNQEKVQFGIENKDSLMEKIRMLNQSAGQEDVIKSDSNVAIAHPEFDSLIRYSAHQMIEAYKKYGPSFLELRHLSMVDQIKIKVHRIRNLEIIGEESRKIQSDDIRLELSTVFNYCALFILMLRNRSVETSLKDRAKLTKSYQEVVRSSQQLLIDKNSDYGSSWETLRKESLTDFILVKLSRIEHILSSKKDYDPQSVTDMLYDCMNYSLMRAVNGQQNNRKNHD